MPKVTVMRGEDIIAGFILGNEPVTIGRGRESDVRVEDKRLSRKHCELRHVDGVTTVTDLESTNGVLYKGERVATATLGEADEFTIGDLRVTLEPERLKAGTIEFAVLDGPDLGAHPPGEAPAKPPEPPLPPAKRPESLLECARRVEELAGRLSGIYDELDALVGRNVRFTSILRKIKEATIEAETLAGE